MLDFRHETFLTLCKLKNFTRTADTLHITQPAVSQHIKHLETYYNAKLFRYEGKTLTLTKQGENLREFATTMSADSEHLRYVLSKNNDESPTLVCGSTLTIGEYIMPSIISKIMNINPNLSISLFVENTETLLKKLQDGKIDFALIEGFFDKSKYSYKTLSTERFIAVCSPVSSIKSDKLSIDKLTNQRLILREKGSGTRDIFEQLLQEHNLTLDSFQNICEIGNISAIKQLVTNNLGITFLYEVAAQSELAAGTLAKLTLCDINVSREFNFVFLKDSVHKKQYLQWYDIFTAK